MIISKRKEKRSYCESDILIIDANLRLIIYDLLKSPMMIMENL
jgi:hypothetical protein